MLPRGGRPPGPERAVSRLPRTADEVHGATPPGAEALWAEAQRLASELRADAEAIETARRLPEPWVRSFQRAGFFRLCVPRSLGGAELAPAELVRVLEALATGDGSAAWCAMIASTSGALAAWLEPDVARRIFGTPDAVVGGVFAPRGRAERVPGGFRASGRWSFASGCQHSSWLLGGCLVSGPDGPERTPAGRPDVRLLLFPAGETEILDTWHVAGLCGTGSHDIAVRELRVPETHSLSLLSDAPREPGPLYAFPVFGLLAVGIAGVALGIARRAIDELNELAAHKTPTLAERRLAERSWTQGRVAEAEAHWGAGRAWLLESVEAISERAAAQGTIPLADRARVRIASTHAVRSAVQAVDHVYELGGGSSPYRASPLQRHFRDVHVLTQHLMVSPASLELAGRVLLGVDADTSML